MASTGGNSGGNSQDMNMREKSQSDFNSAGALTFILSMVVTFGCFIYVSFFSGGIDLKEVKPADSTATQTQAQAAPVKVDISDIKEPWMPNDKMVAHGTALFKQNCQMCHGEKGLGDGIAGANLNPRPRNLVEGKWKQGGSSLELFATLQTGIKGSSMQGYKDAMPAKDRWALVQFIRSITQNKVADKDDELKAKAPSMN